MFDLQRFTDYTGPCWAVFNEGSNPYNHHAYYIKSGYTVSSAPASGVYSVDIKLSTEYTHFVGDVTGNDEEVTFTVDDTTMGGAVPKL